MSFQFFSDTEEEEIIENVTNNDKSNCHVKEVIILGGKLLCSDIYSLMAKTPEELHSIEIQTEMEKSTNPLKEHKRIFASHKLKKSRSFSHEEKQRRERDKSQKQASVVKSKDGDRGSDFALNKGEVCELSVLTKDVDSLASNACLKTRFPPIFQESKSLLKRKQGEHKLQTATKEFLPSLNIKANLNEKNGKRTQGFTNLPTLIHKKGLTVKAPPPSPESENVSSSPTPSALFSEESPIIPRKKPPKSYEDDPPFSERRPTPFPSIWGEDRFFMISIGSSVINEKAKTYMVKEEQE